MVESEQAGVSNSVERGDSGPAFRWAVSWKGMAKEAYENSQNQELPWSSQQKANSLDVEGIVTWGFLSPPPEGHMLKAAMVACPSSAPNQGNPGWVFLPFEVLRHQAEWHGLT